MILWEMPALKYILDTPCISLSCNYVDNIAQNCEKKHFLNVLMLITYVTIMSLVGSMSTSMTMVPSIFRSTQGVEFLPETRHAW